MATTKLKISIVSAIVAASVVVPLLVQQQANAKLREQDNSLRRQTEQLARLQTDHNRLATRAAGATLSRDQLADLQKLRVEVGALRQQTNDVATLRQVNSRLQASLQKPRTPIQIKEETMARMSYSKNWLIAFYQYTDKNQGKFPTRFDQAAPFVSDKVRNRTDVTVDQFEIVFEGSFSTLEKPQDIIVLREKEAWETAPAGDGTPKWARIYGFADGHIEVHHEPINDFEAYKETPDRAACRRPLKGEPLRDEQMDHRYGRGNLRRGNRSFLCHSASDPDRAARTGESVRAAGRTVDASGFGEPAALKHRRSVAKLAAALTRSAPGIVAIAQ